jgi:hypothetical protein
MNSRLVRFALLAVAACSAGASLAQVTPPPLPPGSNLVRPEAGLQEPEKKRYVRAHHHKMHHKKDYTRDDSVFTDPGTQPGNKPSVPPGRAKK